MQTNTKLKNKKTTDSKSFKPNGCPVIPPLGRLTQMYLWVWGQPGLQKRPYWGRIWMSTYHWENKMQTTHTAPLKVILFGSSLELFLKTTDRKQSRYTYFKTFPALTCNSHWSHNCKLNFIIEGAKISLEFAIFKGKHSITLYITI